jgi:hypothetical protein
MNTQKKVLWFSRHDLDTDQLADLNRIFGDVVVTKVSKTINTAFELKDEVDDADIIAIVAPINLQQQFLKLAGNKPVIMSTSDRIITKSDDGSEDKVTFKFKNWIRLVKIDVVTEVL